MRPLGNECRPVHGVVHSTKSVSQKLTSLSPLGFSPEYVLQLFVQNTNMMFKCFGSVGKVPGADGGTRACVARSTCREASMSCSLSRTLIMINQQKGKLHPPREK